MKTVLLIGLGGFVGTMLRYVLSAIPHRHLSTTLPVGTLLVNFLGALVIGYFMEFSLGRSYISDTTRMVIVIGVLGGFTTFSSFSYETISLMRSGNMAHALLNIFLTNSLCFGGTYLGMSLLQRKV